MRYYTVAARLSPPAIGVGPDGVNLDQYRTHTTQHYESPQTVSLPACLLLVYSLSLIVPPAPSGERASLVHTHMNAPPLLFSPPPVCRGSSSHTQSGNT